MKDCDLPLLLCKIDWQCNAFDMKYIHLLCFTFCLYKVYSDADVLKMMWDATYSKTMVCQVCETLHKLTVTTFLYDNG